MGSSGTTGSVNPELPPPLPPPPLSDSSPYMFYPDPIVNLMSCNREPIGSFEEFLDMYDDWWAGEVGKPESDGVSVDGF